jgi:hypothetical protein
MNLFALEGDPATDTVDWEASAASVDDLRVGKMALETAQLLCTAARRHGFEAPYEPTHAGHPCTRWVAESAANYAAALAHGRALLREWADRFGHQPGDHRSSAVLDWCERCLDRGGLGHGFEAEDATPPPTAMPEACRGGGVIASYRRFWLTKPRVRYRAGRVPAWFLAGRELPFELVPHPVAG